MGWDDVIHFHQRLSVSFLFTNVLCRYRVTKSLCDWFVIDIDCLQYIDIVCHVFHRQEQEEFTYMYWSVVITDIQCYLRFIVSHGSFTRSYPWPNQHLTYSLTANGNSSLHLKIHKHNGRESQSINDFYL